jgi:hypothetical protein
MRRRLLTGAAAGALALLLASSALAGFAGTDVFLPMVGRQAGVFPSNWYTTVWIYNPGSVTVTARVYLLVRNTSNPSPPFVEVQVAADDTTKIENAVEALFHQQVFGALRVTCNTQKLVVTSRTFSKGAVAGDKDSVGQDFAGVPASFAIGSGESTQILGVYQTEPAADSEFRFNFGFVETTGHSANITVTAFDQTGENLGSTPALQVRELSQRQLAFKDYFPNVSTDNVRLQVSVTSGAGKIIAYGSGIANGSQDPTTFEMQYKDSLLGIAAVQHDATLTGDGTGGAPLGIADLGVTTAKLADGAVTLPKLSGLQPGGLVFGAWSGGGASQDASQLVWSSSHRLGIGTATPQEQIQLTGNLRLPITTATTGQLKVGDFTFVHGYGQDNTFIGRAAGNFALSGHENSVVGSEAMGALTTGSYNTALGRRALASTTWGESDVAVGYYALTSNVSGFNNVAVGAEALISSTTGSFNVAVGGAAMENTTSGRDNVAVGQGTLGQLTTGSENVAVGELALAANAGGLRNVAVGAESMSTAVSGELNVAVGYGALPLDTSSENVAVGYEALKAATTGTENVAVGPDTLPDVTTGGQNIAIGTGAGGGITAGGNDIVIGTRFTGSDESNTIRIGDIQNATYIAGISGQTSASGVPVLVNADGKLGTQVSSRRYKHAINDMGDESDVLLHLRPVSFYYRPERDPSQTRQFGLIAEEVAAVDPDLVSFSPDGQPEAVRYHFVDAMLLSEVQKQRRTLAAQAEAIAEQAREIARLRRAVAALAATQGR